MATNASQLTPEERASLQCDGYVILRGLLSGAQVAAMRADIDPLIEQARRDPLWSPGGTLHLDGLESVAAFAPVRQSARLAAAVEAILGESFELARMHLRAPFQGHGPQ